MSELPLEEEYMDVLQNIEAAIHNIHVQNAALTDYQVDQALEALVRAYQGEARCKSPVIPRNPLSAQVYEATRAVCEVRMGRAPIPKSLKTLGDGEMVPVSLDVILRCLKRIRKSIRLWTKQGGRQGYLDYISHFLF
ncbi:MAG: hypothetical protein JXA78_02415 [Anaerolineales bacterium]|nr:hypothetical protein [Anaerolineales bacterium]